MAKVQIEIDSMVRLPVKYIERDLTNDRNSPKRKVRVIYKRLVFVLGACFIACTAMPYTNNRHTFHLLKKLFFAGLLKRSSMALPTFKKRKPPYQSKANPFPSQPLPGHTYGLGVVEITIRLKLAASLYLLSRSKLQKSFRFGRVIPLNAHLNGELDQAIAETTEGIKDSHLKDSIKNAYENSCQISSLPYKPGVNVSAWPNLSSKWKGPCLGLPLTVAILSELTNKPIDQSFAMTGAITPEGKIGAVGSIVTKVQAARKQGFTKMIVPEGNRRSLSKIDISGIQIFYVSTIQEALDILYPPAQDKAS